MIRAAKKEGLNITCSVTPYHLALNDESLNTYNSLYKVNPPLRSEADRQALIAGLKDGTIDCIASHHRPQEWDAKAKEFEYASDGMNIQEVAFSIAYQAVGDKVPLARLIDAIAVKPREIFGLVQGVFSKDNTADITLFAVDTEYKAGGMVSLSANNPFADNTFNSKVIGIVSNHKTTLK